jgi:uroporphyrinogen decarboxylase
MADVLTAHLVHRGLDWAVLRDEVDDICQVSPEPIGPAPVAGTDIWGIVRRSQSYGFGSYDEIVTYPLAGAESVEEIDDYPWPDPDAYDFSGFPDRVLAEVRSRDGVELYRATKLSISTCGNPFEIYCWMTGLEEALVNVALRPDLVRVALGHITDFFAAKMRRALTQIGDLIDILYFADDLGGQQTLLMSRRAYREVLQPYHARLFRLGKRLAPQASVMFHTDGAVFDILPDLIDAGVEVLEAVQTDARGMDPGRLKATFGDQLAFHGGIPVQSLLPHQDPATVYRETRRLVDILGVSGGFIAAPTHAVQVGTPPENVLAMLRAALGDQDYATAIAAAQLV